MKTTLNKIQAICISILFFIKTDAQITEHHIYGVWTLLSSQNIFKANTNNPVVLPDTNLSEKTKVVFLKNGIGYIVPKDKTDDGFEFGWKLINDTIEIQEDMNISWWDKYHINYKKNKLKSYMYIEQTYRRRTYKELYSFENERIKLKPSANIVLNDVECSDIYLANGNKRIIEQTPIVTCGIYNKKENTLYVERKIYEQLLRLKEHVQIEMFIKNYISRNPQSIASFLVTFCGNTPYANFIEDYSNYIKWFSPRY